MGVNFQQEANVRVAYAYRDQTSTMEVSSFMFFLAGLIVSSATTIVLFHLFEVKSKKKEDRSIAAKDETKKAVNSVATKAASVSAPSSGGSGKTPLSYRIEEENNRTLSSEYTRRGQLWSRHASWHLPKAPREESSRAQLEAYYLGHHGLDRIQAILQKYDIDIITGFLPSKDPLQRLPYARYHLWEDLGDDLPKLLGARLGQARDPLEQLPVLSTDKLITDAELRRAHLLLCLFAHSYVWGGTTPMDRIPEGIAKPLCEVSERLGIPPVLGHPSIVLYNWRRLDAKGEICMENLATLNNFFDGRDESWFYLITVEIEARGAPAIVPTMLAMDAIQRYNEEEELKQKRGTKSRGVSIDVRYQLSERSSNLSADNTPVTATTSTPEGEESEESDQEIIYTNEALVGSLESWRVAVFVTAQLHRVATAIKGMTESILNMREGCHPFIFYHRVRPFLSGWKHNPTMPRGVIYEGVSTEPFQFYGGSAAQSALLPFLDITLGVTHDSNKSRDFLLAMRDYMYKQHREFLEFLTQTACLRPFITQQLELLNATNTSEPLSSSQRDILLALRDAYDDAMKALQGFRSGHINIVAEYIVAQQRHSVHKGTLEGSAGGRGTGGTELMSFLKPIRDDCVNKYASFRLLECFSNSPGYVFLLLGF